MRELHLASSWLLVFQRRKTFYFQNNTFYILLYCLDKYKTCYACLVEERLFQQTVINMVFLYISQ